MFLSFCPGGEGYISIDDHQVSLGGVGGMSRGMRWVCPGGGGWICRGGGRYVQGRGGYVRGVGMSRGRGGYVRGGRVCPGADGWVCLGVVGMSGEVTMSRGKGVGILGPIVYSPPLGILMPKPTPSVLTPKCVRLTNGRYAMLSCFFYFQQDETHLHWC